MHRDKQNIKLIFVAIISSILERKFISPSEYVSTPNQTCTFSFGYFPGVRLSFSDVSEPSVRSIFKGSMKNFFKSLKMDLTGGSETSAKINLTPGKYPKENIQDSEHSENLKSRTNQTCLSLWCLICF
jgi:hypothetical protein